MIEVTVVSHQYRCQTHKAMQYRHQFRHFGHFDFTRQVNADAAANNHGDDNPADIAGMRPDNCRQQRNRHAADTKQIALLRGFVFGQSRQAENK